MAGRRRNARWLLRPTVLDGLKLGRYRILINNKPAMPEWIEIFPESEQMMEIDLKSN